MARFEDYRNRVDRLSEQDLAEDARMDYDCWLREMYKLRKCSYCGNLFTLFHSMEVACRHTGGIISPPIVFHTHFDFSSEGHLEHDHVTMSRDHYLCLRARGWLSTGAEDRVTEEGEVVRVARQWVTNVKSIMSSPAEL